MTHQLPSPKPKQVERAIFSGECDSCPVTIEPRDIVVITPKGHKHLTCADRADG